MRNKKAQKPSNGTNSNSALSEDDKIVERLAATKKDVSSVRLVTIPEPSSAEIGIMDDDINMQTDDPKDQYQRKQRKITVSNFTL